MTERREQSRELSQIPWAGAPRSWRVPPRWVFLVVGLVLGAIGGWLAAS